MIERGKCEPTESINRQTDLAILPSIRSTSPDIDIPHPASASHIPNYVERTVHDNTTPGAYIRPWHTLRVRLHLLTLA